MLNGNQCLIRLLPPICARDSGNYELGISDLCLVLSISLANWFRVKGRIVFSTVVFVTNQVQLLMDRSLAPMDMSIRGCHFHRRTPN